MSRKIIEEAFESDHISMGGMSKSTNSTINSINSIFAQSLKNNHIPQNGDVKFSKLNNNFNTSSGSNSLNFGQDLKSDQHKFSNRNMLSNDANNSQKSNPSKYNGAQVRRKRKTGDNLYMDS